MLIYIQILHTVMSVALIAYNLLFDYWFKNFNNEFYFHALSLQKRLSRKERVLEKDLVQLSLLFKYKQFRMIRFIIGKNKTNELEKIHFILTNLLDKDYRPNNWASESKYLNKYITDVVRAINDLHGPLSRNSERFGTGSGVIVLVSFIVIYSHQLMEML